MQGGEGMAVYQTIISSTGAKVLLDDRYFANATEEEILQRKMERDRAAGDILAALADRMRETP
jgi:hypothetical protein